MKAALETVVLHLFNDHSKCVERKSANDRKGWCKASWPGHVPMMLQNHGGWMKDEAGVKNTLIETFAHYTQPATLEQIVNARSNNQQESLHSTVTLMSHKRVHNLRAGTYVGHVHAGALQKNLGQGWQKLVLEELGLAYVRDAARPGTRVFEQLQNRDRQQAEWKGGRERKKRRVELKAKRRKTNSSWHQEEAEGGSDAMYGSKAHQLPRQAAAAAAAESPEDADRDSASGSESDGEREDADAGSEYLNAEGLLEFIVDPATMPEVMGVQAEGPDDEGESDSGYDSDRPMMCLRC